MEEDYKHQYHTLLKEYNNLVVKCDFMEKQLKGVEGVDPIPMEGMPWNIPGGIHSPEAEPARDFITRDALYHMTQGEDPSQDRYTLHTPEDIGLPLPLPTPPKEWPD